MLAAIFAIAPPGNKRLDVAQERPRLEMIAEANARAIVKNPHEIGYKGPAAARLKAIDQVATAWPESYFDAKAQRCIKKGDNGNSTTIFQLHRPWSLQRKVWKTKRYKQWDGTWKTYKVWVWVNHHTEKELCKSDELAAEQFMHMWHVNEQRFKWAVPHHLFQAYVTGRPKSWLRRVTGRCLRWARIANKMGLRDERTVKKDMKKPKKGDKVSEEISCWRMPEWVIIDPRIDIDKLVEKQLNVYPKPKKNVKPKP